MWFAIKSVISLIVSALLTVFPGNAFLESFDVIQFTEKNDGCLMNAAILSDIHIDVEWAIGEWVWETGLKDLGRSVDPVDALIVPGDLTNYGDSASMRSFFDIIDNNNYAENWVIAMGNHDVGHVEDITQEEARQYFIKTFNELNPQGDVIEKAYYKTDIDGYRFVVLCDDGDDTWDCPDMTPEQIQFLDDSLAEAADRGLPMFVICHVPVEGVNGQDVIYPDGGLDDNSEAVQTILEKYENVFFISGHVHTGINGPLVEEAFGFSCVETINGVNYINLPTYMIVNRYGVPWGGMGFQMEVYEDEVLFRARNYFTSKWYPVYDHSVSLV